MELVFVGGNNPVADNIATMFGDNLKEKKQKKEFIFAPLIWTSDPMVQSTLRTGTMNAQADTAPKMNPLQERFTGLLQKISNRLFPPLIWKMLRGQYWP